MTHREFVEWAAYADYRASEWERVTNKGKKGQLADVW